MFEGVQLDLLDVLEPAAALVCDGLLRPWLSVAGLFHAAVEAFVDLRAASLRMGLVVDVHTVTPLLLDSFRLEI
ncbi:MAG: hypothetical protein AAGJ81_16250 [Verrucomicrobiota bacterium]